jgi:hypothetical protein
MDDGTMFQRGKRRGRFVNENALQTDDYLELTSPIS